MCSALFREYDRLWSSKTTHGHASVCGNYLPVYHASGKPVRGRYQVAKCSHNPGAMDLYYLTEVWRHRR